MKKLFTLGFCLLFLNTVMAQKLDYDNDSKWFFGFNIGATWNTTDVKNKTNLGWGLTLGRAFNYNYGKKLSFDLRLRYLGGNWYGQDYDTTNVTGNSLYDPNGPVVDKYDSLGYTINNFNTEAHEVGLEFVLHLNSLREKTGFDPYIFGGVGVAWNQTHGDLIPQDQLDSLTFSNGYYPYSADGISKTELNQLSDEIYDTPLDGSSGSYNVNFIPSVGIGIAYQVGPKFSIGLEHRTMFFLENTFDGYAGNSSKWGGNNDLYHYSGVNLKFHLGRKGSASSETSTPGGTSPVTDNGCKEPNVRITQPSLQTLTVYEQEYELKAIIDRIAGRDNIQFSVNGSTSTNFSFNPSNGQFASNVLLRPGNNDIKISASNACGTDGENITINYVDCRQPVVRFTNPKSAKTTVDSAPYVINATIENAEAIEFQVNGMNSSNFMYNAADKQFQSSITLMEGINTIRIIGRSDCGTDEQVVQIEFVNCTVPRIDLVGGAGTHSVSEAHYGVSANIEHVQSQSDISFTVNGVETAFTYNLNSKRFVAETDLMSGQNIIKIRAGNGCGSDVETLTVNLVDCADPEIIFVAPQRDQGVTSETFDLKVMVENVTNVNQIQLKVNNTLISGGTFNSSTKLFERTITVNSGSNVVSVTATNECGTNTGNVKLNYTPCIDPTVSFTTPTSNLTTIASTQSIKVKLENVTSINQVLLKVNNTVVTGGTFNPVSELFEHTIDLTVGSNVVEVTGTNDCGQAAKSITITRRACTGPTINVTQPENVSSSTPHETMLVKANLTGITSSSQVQLKVNGSEIVGGTYNVNTHLFQKNITLNTGANTIELIATNDCSSTTQTLEVNYSPCTSPDISLISPSRGSLVTTNSTQTIKASITNISDVSQVKLKVNGTVASGGTYNASTSIYSAQIRLSEGESNIEILVSNDCGEESETFAIEYNPCLEPTATLLKPTSSLISSTTGQIQIKVGLTNVTDVNQVVLTVNGTEVSGGSIGSAKGAYSHSLTLTEPGTNNIVITVKNACGESSVNFSVKFAPPCSDPVITVIAPTVPQVNTESVTVKAHVTNVSQLSEIEFFINNVKISGGTFNSATKVFEIDVTLALGQTALKIQATNSCGRDVKSFPIVRQETGNSGDGTNSSNSIDNVERPDNQQEEPSKGTEEQPEKDRQDTKETEKKEDTKSTGKREGK